MLNPILVVSFTLEIQDGVFKVLVLDFYSIFIFETALSFVQVYYLKNKLINLSLGFTQSSIGFS
jgi:hypothetical protein